MYLPLPRHFAPSAWSVIPIECFLSQTSYVPRTSASSTRVLYECTSFERVSCSCGTTALSWMRVDTAAVQCQHTAAVLLIVLQQNYRSVYLVLCKAISTIWRQHPHGLRVHIETSSGTRSRSPAPGHSRSGHRAINRRLLEAVMPLYDTYQVCLILQVGTTVPWYVCRDVIYQAGECHLRWYHSSSTGTYNVTRNLERRKTC